MSKNKNQHFVPRCYLKPFSKNGEGRGISLFNIGSGQAVEWASVSGQCAGNYFYGQDEGFESALQADEREYAEIRNRLWDGDGPVSLSEQHFLRVFWCLQFLRTEALSKRMLEMKADWELEVGIPYDQLPSTLRDTVMGAISVLPAASRAVADLDFRIVRNTSPISFIASDNPAIMTNRWYAQDRRAIGISPGLPSSGTVLMLPISPRTLVLMFDRNVYSVPHLNGVVRVRKSADIGWFNAHQLANCNSDVYFSIWDERKIVAQSYVDVAPRRPTSRHRISFAEFDHKDDSGGDVYRFVEQLPREPRYPFFSHIESVTYLPDRWPPFLAYRSGGTVYSNGSAAGFRRKAQIGNSPSWRGYPSRSL